MKSNYFTLFILKQYPLTTIVFRQLIQLAE